MHCCCNCRSKLLPQLELEPLLYGLLIAEHNTLAACSVTWVPVVMNIGTQVYASCAMLVNNVATTLQSIMLAPTSNRRSTKDETNPRNPRRKAATSTNGNGKQHTAHKNQAPKSPLQALQQLYQQHGRPLPQYTLQEDNIKHELQAAQEFRTNLHRRAPNPTIVCAVCARCLPCVAKEDKEPFPIREVGLKSIPSLPLLAKNLQLVPDFPKTSIHDRDLPRVMWMGQHIAWSPPASKVLCTAGENLQIALVIVVQTLLLTWFVQETKQLYVGNALGH